LRSQRQARRLCVTKAMDGGLERPQGTIAVVRTHGTIRNTSDS